MPDKQGLNRTDTALASSVVDASVLDPVQQRERPELKGQCTDLHDTAYNNAGRGRSQFGVSTFVDCANLMQAHNSSLVSRHVTSTGFPVQS